MVQLQFREHAEERSARWRLRTKIADKTIACSKFDVTHASRSTVHEHGPDRRSEWIIDGQPLESVVVDEVRRSVSRKLGFRT